MDFHAPALFRSRWLTGAIGLALGLVLGPGSFWRLRETESLARGTQLQAMQLSLEARGRLSDVLLEWVKESAHWGALVECDSTTAGYSVGNRMAEITSHLDVLATDISTIENQLAELEHRSPRDEVLRYLEPQAPKALTITMTQPSGEEVWVAGPDPKAVRPSCPKL
jgi:hypothetical protein